MSVLYFKAEGICMLFKVYLYSTSTHTKTLTCWLLSSDMSKSQLSL